MLASKALAAAVSQEPVYVEDVFSTYLYTGNGSTQTITNGIDLSGKGGLVWTKNRASANHSLIDTARGSSNWLMSNTTAASNSDTTLSSFNNNGYSLNGTAGTLNSNTNNYASWTFRKQAKFFDVVTWTGNGSNRTISHNLGSVPGCIIIKRTDTTANWAVYHRSIANTQYMVLNTTAAAATGATWWNSTTPTSTVFSLGTSSSVNASGGTYVAYLFAHNAGGFGLSGTDNVISCGFFTGTGTVNTPTITLGYEPQWLLIKSLDGTVSTNASSWTIWDTMRGIVTGGADTFLRANTADVDSSFNAIQVTSTGFQIETDDPFYNESGSNYIYIAIRRGPMKVPTSGTSVFSPTASSAAAGTSITTNFPVDLNMFFYRSGTDSGNTTFEDRLRGMSRNSTDTAGGQLLRTSSTAAETTTTVSGYEFWNTDWKIGSYYGGSSSVYYSFRRAPGFMDVVCYTGTGANLTLDHNLGAAPELMIVKNRSNAANWRVYDAFNGATKRGSLNDSQAWDVQSSMWNDTAPTAAVFTVGTSNSASSQTYVAYLFATLAGVSKVGSYTGSGTTKQIDCGFTAGARFVLIKRTDSTGDWYVWDTARGIVSGNDPYLLLNSTAAEVTSTDYIDPYSAGFEISSTAPAAINANGGSFIFFAVA